MSISREAQAFARLGEEGLDALLDRARALTLQGYGLNVTYSKKVFIPLTRLCRNVCRYCTFAQRPRAVSQPFLNPDQVLEIARAGAAAGCKEALFTLGDKPELRYADAREALQAAGYASTIDYLVAMARLVRQQTGLLPHINAGVMTVDELRRIREVSVSAGLMLESSSPRLCERDGPHWGCPDKAPATRLATLRAAGELAIPITSGILIGIGETRLERIEALLELRALHAAHEHIQEIIVQNFRRKSDTAMAQAAEPTLDDQMWTIVMTRLIFGPTMSIQAPPNLRPTEIADLIRSGINDFGGISPITPDHVNPEAPWPNLASLAAQTEAAGRHLVERLALVPAYAQQADRWVDPSLVTAVLHATDSCGHARDDWFAGSGADVPIDRDRFVGVLGHNDAGVSAGLQRILERRLEGRDLCEADIVALFAARGRDLCAVLDAADGARAASAGDAVTYVVNCNINYTNICKYRCGFCAFAKGRSAEHLRGPAYMLDPDAVAARAVEAWERGATEVCMQGGIHPAYTGETYLRLVRAVKAAVPEMHVHAFSPLEIMQGATTLGLPLAVYLRMLREAGLSSLPGTAAEILDDEVRAIICPDKLGTEQWFDVMREAHAVGLRSTATIMFGHVERPTHWARHLIGIRCLQQETGGFTEFVPLPFVHMESPLWRKGRARSGPTLREAVLMHAVARLVLDPLIVNVQTSWVKMGPHGAALCLASGANDLGGTLMYESITRAAGGVNGQCVDDAQLRVLAARLGRPARQRTTLYQSAAVSAFKRAAYAAGDLVV